MTAKECLEEQAVFKEWAQSWIRRSLIKNAIGVVSTGVTPRLRTTGVLERRAKRSREKRRDQCPNPASAPGTLRFCNVDSGALFGLGVFSSAGVQH
jgi:hypothetical protein